MPPRLVIFDLDNTLYCEPPELSQACEEAMARAAAEMIEGLTYEAALYISQTSNHQTGSVRTYIAERYEIDPAALHQNYHDKVDHLILPVCENTKEAFVKIDTEQITLGLLTHGSRGWTDRVLDHLGLADYFPAALRVPIEDVDFHHKHESERPFHEIMTKASAHLCEVIQAGQCMVVEDVARNLVVPHSMGMQTVLVNHGEEMPAQDNIDFQVSSIGEFIDNFLAANPKI